MQVQCGGLLLQLLQCCLFFLTQGICFGFFLIGFFPFLNRFFQGIEIGGKLPGLSDFGQVFFLPGHAAFLRQKPVLFRQSLFQCLEMIGQEKCFFKDLPEITVFPFQLLMETAGVLSLLCGGILSGAELLRVFCFFHLQDGRKSGFFFLLFIHQRMETVL